MIVIEVKHGNYFVGSVPPDNDQISVEGHLRTGRSVEAKRSLVERIVEAVAQAAAMPKSHVWAHLVDMPATQIVEFGPQTSVRRTVSEGRRRLGHCRNKAVTSEMRV